jgi:hypothetical protein
MENGKRREIKMIKVFQFFGVLSIIGGLILAKVFWPDVSLLGTGYSYKAIAYLPSISFGIWGIICAFIFFAISSILINQQELQGTVNFIYDKVSRLNGKN